MAAKIGLRFEINDHTYVIDLDHMTAGEARLLKREYGMENILDYELLDPEILMGLMVLAIKRTDSDLTDHDIELLAAGVDIIPLLDQLREQLETAAEEGKAKAEQDPPSAAGNGSGPAASKPGKRATTRKTSGTSGLAAHTA